MIANSLRSKLESSPTHGHVSLELTNLWVNRRVYELEMLLAKVNLQECMLACILVCVLLLFNTLDIRRTLNLDA